jgi:hypothetical protein
VFVVEFIRGSNEKEISRDRSKILKGILEELDFRRIEPDVFCPHDPYDIQVAELVLRSVGIPFFADTNSNNPKKLCELSIHSGRRICSTEPPMPSNDSCLDHIDAAHRIKSFTVAAAEAVLSRFGEEPIALSIRTLSPRLSITTARTDESVTSPSPVPRINDRRPSSVYLADEEVDEAPSVDSEAHVWTLGRMLRFIRQERFIEQLWDLCLSSHCIVPRCALAAAVGPHVPLHLSESWWQYCRTHVTEHAVISPLLSVCSDLQYGREEFDSSGRMHVGLYSRFRWENLQWNHTCSLFSAEPAIGKRTSLLSVQSMGMMDCSKGDFSSQTPSEGERENPLQLLRTPLFSINSADEGNLAFDPYFPQAAVPGSRTVAVRAADNIFSQESLRLVIRRADTKTDL